LALVTFYALNPAWWSNPAQRLSDVLQARSALLRDQTQTYGSYPDFGAQVAGFFRQTFTDSIMIAEVPVDDFIPRQQDRIQYYQQSGLAGWHPGTILLPVLSAVGLLHLWQRRCRESAVILCWLLATIVLTLFLTPLEWQRYYLPIYPVTLLTAAGGLSAIIGWIGQYSVQRDRKVENNG
jgi:4-amino-4-deoxy-L-arabinose transferase-like glycosyltransferase